MKRTFTWCSRPIFISGYVIEALIWFLALVYLVIRDQGGCNNQISGRTKSTNVFLVCVAMA